MAGCRTADELDALLKRYEDTFPGTVTKASQEHGGLPTVVVKAPSRRPVISLSALADTVRSTGEKAHDYGQSGAVSGADTRTADTASADTARPTIDDDIQIPPAPLRRPPARPLIGDELYPVWLAERANAGLLTEDEFSEQYARHRLVERSLEAA